MLGAPEASASGRRCGLRHSQTRPSTTSTAPAPRNASCWTRYVSGGASEAVLACWDEAKSREIQWCVISQMTFGSRSASAISTPNSASRRNSRSRRQSAQPARKAASGTTIVYLDSRPRPPQRPSRIHCRSSLRTTRRTAASSASAVAASSRNVGWKSTAPPRAKGVTSQAAVASTCIRWPAPNSRAIAPAATAATAASSELSRRRLISDGPIVPSTSRAATAVSNGKSTYPNARCRPAARK